jgi:hypothetical protein
LTNLALSHILVETIDAEIKPLARLQRVGARWKPDSKRNGKWTAEGAAKEPVTAAQTRVSRDATPALLGEGCVGILLSGRRPLGCSGNQGGTADRSLSLTLAYVLQRKTGLVSGWAFLFAFFRQIKHFC